MFWTLIVFIPKEIQVSRSEENTYIEDYLNLKMTFTPFLGLCRAWLHCMAENSGHWCVATDVSGNENK